MPEITTEELREYEGVGGVQRQVGAAGEWTDEVLQYCMTGENLSGIKLPWPCLDTKFRLQEGSTSLMCGQSGSGKSMLAGQFALHAMEQGYKSLIVSLEMTVRSSIARMARQKSLVPPGMDEVLDFARWTNGKLWFYRQQGSINFKTLLAVVRYTVAKLGVKFIVVDSLMTMGDIPSEDYQGQRRLMLALSIAARDLGVHILLITHARKGLSVDDRLDKFSVAGSADLTNLACSVILLQRTAASRRERDATAPDATFEIAKARHFDTAETTLDLWFDTASYNYQTKWDTPRIVGEKDENTVSKSEGTTVATVGEITIVGGTASKGSGRRVKVNGGSGRGSDAVASG
jgi:twinkle protein